MKRVLICDDAAFMRGSIKLMLERNGFQIAGEAENGEDAINKYKELMPDVVTMDITMPKMDGVSAVKQIVGFNPNAKIVMISAMGLESMVKDAILSGAKGFVVKPFKEEILINAINKMG